MDVLRQRAQGLVRRIRQAQRRQAGLATLLRQVQPAVRQALGPQSGQHRVQLLPVAGLGRQQLLRQVAAGRQVDHDRFAGLPETGYLQDPGTGQAPVREQQVFKEFAARLALARVQVHFQRHARQLGQCLPLRGIERQRHQRGPRFHHLEAELARDLQAEVGRAQLRNRHAAGRHHQLGGADRALAGAQLETLLAVGDLGHRTAHAPLHIAGVALGAQHVDDGFAGVVAEKLSAVLLVPGDAVALHQRQKVLRRIGRQGRPAEMRIVGKKIGGSGADVREVAAASAGNADLLRQALRVVDQHHAQAALTGHRCTHHASGAGAEYGYIKHQDSRPAGSYSSIRQST
ncbi:hypothetical protein D3C85_280030 [compost metagenome]